jgi:hypothetical protein
MSNYFCTNLDKQATLAGFLRRPLLFLAFSSRARLLFSFSLFFSSNLFTVHHASWLFATLQIVNTKNNVHVISTREHRLDARRCPKFRGGIMACLHLLRKV